jgi:hypothetical protein
MSEPRLVCLVPLLHHLHPAYAHFGGFALQTHLPDPLPHSAEKPDQLTSNTELENLRSENAMLRKSLDEALQAKLFLWRQLDEARGALEPPACTEVSKMTTMLQAARMTVHTNQRPSVTANRVWLCATSNWGASVRLPDVRNRRRRSRRLVSKP